MFSLDGKGLENAGNVIGAALVYSGNYKLKTVTDDTEYHYFFAGINEQNSEYHLKRVRLLNSCTRFDLFNTGLERCK